VINIAEERGLGQLRFAPAIALDSKWSSAAARPALSRRLSLFLALSAADLLLTYFLLRHSSGEVYESNPVANWWLSAYGWAGLVVFKTAAVALAVGLLLVVAWRRPHLGRFLATFACLAVSLVVAYSASMAVREYQESGSQAALALEDRDRQRQADECFAFALARDRLGKGLLDGSRFFPEVVEELARLDRAHNPLFLKMLAQNFPGRTLDQALAANILINAVLLTRDDAEAVKQAALRLLPQYASCYGLAAPWTVWDLQLIACSELDRIQKQTTQPVVLDTRAE
jgi:Domain of unknown function (DUF5658)